MPSKSRKIRVPSLCLHRASGRAVARIGGRDHYFGRFGTPEAEAAYRAAVAAWVAGLPVPEEPRPASLPASAPSVNAVLLGYLRSIEGGP